MEKTTDYSIFEKEEKNRELSETNVIRIMKSIQAKNLLCYRPILVDKDMKIIDGQHRLEAAKRLKIPIYYEVSKTLSSNDIILLNSNSKFWSFDDYLNFYVNSGLEDYVKLDQLCKKNKITVIHALNVLGKRGGRNSSKNFKHGEFKYPNFEDERDALDILDFSKEIITYFKSKNTGYIKYVDSGYFLRALYIFLSIRSVDRSIFKEKIEYRLDLLRPAPSIMEYLRIFKMIYNWRNKSPISMEDEIK